MKLKLTIKKYSIYKNAYLWSENFLRYRKPNNNFYKLKSKFKDISILESVIGGENKGRYSIIFFNIVENVEIYENYALKNNKKIKISSPNNYLKEISKLTKVKNHYNLPIPIPFLIGNMCFDLSKFTLPKLKYDRSKKSNSYSLGPCFKTY